MTLVTHVPPDGPLDARFGIIGEGPGPEEEKKGSPFIGPSGKIVMDGAKTGSLPRDWIRITNVSPYRVEEEDAILRSLRLQDQIPALQAEVLQWSEARTILLIGADAVEAVLGICGPQKDPDNPHRRLTATIQDYHGSTFTRDEALALQAWAAENGIRTVRGLPPKVHSVAVTLHPAFALHGNMPRFKLAIKMAIGRAAMRSRQAVGPQRPQQSVFDLDAPAEAVQAYLQGWDTLGLTPAVDVETPRHDAKKIILCGVGLTERVLVFQWTMDHLTVMREWFRRSGWLSGHNFLYDLRAFAAYDVRPAPDRMIADTMIACSKLQPVDDEVRSFPWLSLSTCVARHMPGFYHWKEADRSCQQALYRATFPWARPEQSEALYNGLDIWATSGLWSVVQPLLQREGMW